MVRPYKIFHHLIALLTPRFSQRTLNTASLAESAVEEPQQEQAIARPAWLEEMVQKMHNICSSDSRASATPEAKAQDRPELLFTQSPHSSRWPASSPGSNKESYYSSDEEIYGIDEDEVDLDTLESLDNMMGDAPCNAHGPRRNPTPHSEAARDVQQRTQWTQTHDEITVYMPAQAQHTSKDISFRFTATSLLMGIRGAEPFISGNLYGQCDPEESSWQFAPHRGTRCVHLTIVKRHPPPGHHWPSWPILVHGP